MEEILRELITSLYWKSEIIIKKKLELFIKCEEKNSTLIADIADMEKKQIKDYIKKW